MAEFKLGRLRFVWQGEWTTGTQYVKDDIVRYGGSSYVCVLAHTAAPDFYTNFDAGNWQLMTGGLQWKTEPWTAGTYYAEGDVVRYGGKIFVAVNGHTASADFNTDFDGQQWQLFVDGVQWKNSVWSGTTLYKEGDLVRHGGRVYICTDGHTSSAGFEQDFVSNKWQLFSDGVQWKAEPWTASTLYKVSDIVRVSGKTYICVDEHTSSSTQRGGFYEDLGFAKWQLFADGNQYQGVWDATSYYWLGDLVRYGARTYVCVLGHEADTDFYTDLDSNRWELLNDGQQWTSDWNNGQWYRENDLVKHGGTVYICLNGHFADSSYVEGFDNDLQSGQWEIFSTGYDWKSQWITGTYYKLNDIVRYGAKAYICVLGHVAAADFNNDVDSNKWQLLVDGQQWKTSPWQIGTVYKEGDLTRYGGRVYICVNGHISTSFQNRFDIDFDAGNWQLFSDGTQWKTEPWTAGTYYKTGDIVKYGGKTYIAIDDHLSDQNQEGGFYLDLDNSKWNLYADGTEWRGDWTVSTYYRLGDIARYDGNVYICQTPHISASTIEEGLESDLDLDSTQAKWDVFSEGFKFKGAWATDTKYNVNDVVKFGGSLYICIGYHVSDISSFEEIYWSLLIGGLEFEDTWSSAVEYQIGDIVTYGGYSYVSQTRNIGKIPPGFALDWNLLTTGFKVTGEWNPGRSYKVGELVKYGGNSYVAIVEAGPGQKPTNNDGSTSVLWEIVAPGFKWRGTWEADQQYRLGDAIRWISNTYVCILDHTSANDSLNQPDNDAEGIYWNSLAEGAETNVLTRRGDLVTRDAIQNKRLPRGQKGQVLQVQGSDVVWDYFNVVDNVYYVTTDGIDGPERGTTLQTPFRTIKYACEYIQQDLANRSPATVYVKTGVYSEELPIVVPAGVALVGDELRSTRIQPAPGFGVDSVTVISGGANYTALPTVSFSLPTIPGGNVPEAYATLSNNKVSEIIITKAGSGYESAPIVTLTGGGYTVKATVSANLKSKVYSQTNMFLLRDATGIRNMTFRNLDVPLGSANQYFTKRPTTDCAYVSLDPGFGPGDESTWITTRSPYVQNVTTYGNGAVGMKIDGAIHNGGYKTMVCNDFTQVISDGIGIWATNQGRVEAVSVFTYYSHLGYLAEDGGVIRGTNGNCSYGTFGVSAEGVDPSEISRISRVNNRKEEANIVNTFVDGSGIVHLEFSNAGENYQPGNTTYEFGGNGIPGTIVVDQVVTQDGGVFEVRVLDPGSSWLSVVNNAQDGTNRTIRVSASDVQTTNAYKGERIVIIDGQGVGQHGYITYFDGGTKVATIARESFKPLIITASSSLNNRLTTADTSTLTVNMPVSFDFEVVPVIASATSNSTDTITVNDATKLAVGMPIKFTGTVFGNIVNNTTYYIHTIVDRYNIKISESSGGAIFNLIDGTGTLAGEAGAMFGGVNNEGEVYYVRQIINETTFTLTDTVGGAERNLTTANGKMSMHHIGWESFHNEPIESILDTTTRYTIEPRVVFSTGEYADATAVVSKGVDTITFASNGGYYQSAPAVLITGTESDATGGEASVTISGSVSSVRIREGGSGYVTQPNVTFIGGGLADGSPNHATGTANVTGKITSVAVTSGGSGYEIPPEITISGTGYNNDAYLSAKITNIVGFIDVVSPGSTYTSVPTVTISGGGGSGAEAIVNLDAVITGFTIAEGGSGYTPITTSVTITPAPGDSVGGGAQATAIIDNGETGGPGVITGISLVNPGSGYTAPPIVTVSSIGTGSGAEVYPLISGVVDSITVIKGGSGYVSAPDVTFSSGTAQAVAAITGAVYAVEIINGGSGFEDTATIQFVSNSPAAGATAVAVVSRVVESVTITDPGTGYTSVPTVSITGSTGTGALGTVILNAAINNITVTKPGANYATTPTVSFVGGHNFSSVLSGLAYYKNASSLVAVSSLQIRETLAAMEYIKTLATAIATNSNPSTAYQGILSRTGSAIAPVGALNQTKLWIDVIKSIAQNGNSNRVASDLISSNKSFILEQVSAYAVTELSGITYTDADLRKKVKLVLEALIYDLYNNTVERTVAIGQQYGRVVTGELAASTTILTYVKSLVQDIIANAVIVENQSVENQVFAELLASEFTAPKAIDNCFNLVAAINALNGAIGSTSNSTYTDLLIANKVWIQAEVTEYIKNNYVYFEYDQAKCERDTGIILDAIAMDLALGTNFNSVTAGLAYQRANALTVKANQIAKTIDAIEYAKEQAIALTAVKSNTLAKARAAAGFDEIVDIIRNGTGAANALTFPTPTGASQDLVDAKDQLQENKTFLRAEITAWIAVNYPAVAATYDADACSRDVGYIIDALSYDILYGGNSATRTAAQAYFVGALSQLGAGESTATAAAYAYLATIVGQVVQGTDVTKTSGNTQNQDKTSGNATSAEASVLDNLLQIIEDVITDGDLSSLPSVTYPNVSWTASGLQTAKTAINNAKTSIVSSTIVDINSTAGFDYNEALCARDVGIIIDSIAHDVRYAQDAIPVSSATTTNVVSSITVDNSGEGYGQGTTVLFSGDLGSGTAPAATPIILDGEITGFNITQSGKGFTNPPAVTIVPDSGSGAYARAFVLGALVQQIRIVRPGSGYTAAPYVKLIDPNNTAEARLNVRIGDGVLDQPTYISRGVAYLAAASTVSGTSGYADSYQVGEFVYVQNLTNIPTPGANIQFSGNPQFYKLVTVRDLQGAPGLSGGRNLIVANRAFVQRQVIAYINATYPNLDYNENLCFRDVGLIIDAIVADIFGDTERGIEAGKSYYRSQSSLQAITGDQLAPTLAAIDKIEDYLIDIVQNIEIPRNQLLELQVKEPGITGGSAAIGPMQNTLDIIRDIIQNGDAIYDVQDLLLDNKSYVQAEVMAFINTTYPDLDYNQDLCRRDVGLIVDAIAYDLFAGLGAHYTTPNTPSGLARSREAGLRYYSNASARIAITEQKAETIAAIEHIADVAIAVISNVKPSIVYQADVQPIINLAVVASQTLKDRVQDGIDEIVNIINNGVEVLPSGTYSARLQISPPFTVDNAPEHDVSVVIRSKYSQVRLTNHDFLNVGTGNKAETNYPGVPVNAPDEANEVLEAGGGRCFYTSTDQDGNFRVGELFAVEQATGIATLNADAFNLSGLNELSLGGINIGGTGATITEFSTDSLFFANSDSIVPTQKAIKTYIASQLGSGGGNLAVNAITAGDIQITGNIISTNYNEGLDITVPEGIFVTENISSTDTTTGSLVVAGGVGIGENLNVGGDVNIATDLVVQGNLTVNGSTTTLNVGSLSIEDNNVVIASAATTAIEADGAGLTVAGPTVPATFIYASADDSWNANKVVKATSLQATPIGSITRSTAAFTTLAANNSVTFTKGTDSTSTNNGTLVVTGGVGISGNAWVGGKTNTVGLDASGSVTLSPDNASVQMNPSGTGGVVISPTGAAGLTISPTVVGTLDNVNIGGTTRGTAKFTTLETNGDVLITSATASTSTDTGALQVDGGAGINGALYAGSIQNTPIGSTTANTGAFTTLTTSGTVELSPAGKNVNVKPTQSGIATTAITSSATTITVTHGTGTIARFTVGDYVSITGATPAAYNGTWLVATAPADGTFTIASTLNPGTATVQGTVGYGTVVVKPTGGLAISPTAVGTIDNVNIGSSVRGAGAFTTLTSNAAVTLTANTSSSSSTTGTLVVTGGVGISENLSVGGAVTITGNLTVNGTTTTINSTDLSVDDINIVLGDTASPTDTTANGGGITLKGTTNKTISWVSSTGYWTFNQGVQASSIQNTPIGSSTANTGAFTSLTANGAVTFTQNTASTSTTTGTLVVTGGLGVSGRVNATDFTGTIGANTASAGSFTTLGASSTVTFTQANANVTISPTGTGTVTINPATAGTINNVAIGGTTRAAGAFTTLSANSTFSLTDTTDSSTTGTGALVVSGGIGIAKQATINNVKITATTASTSTSTGALIVAGGVGIAGSLYATTKSFDIKHPGKEGYGLRHGSLEGPEFGVYVRGKISGSNVIELPDYWISLVDEATITVNLTAVGSAQALYVEKIEGNKVYVGGGDNFFYTVYGERKDVPNLEVEYKA